MPTSEINRLLKAVKTIALKNGQKYCCVEISCTDNGYDSIIKKVYKGYINEIAPWINSDSSNGLISAIKEYIEIKKEDKFIIENNSENDNIKVIIDDLPF